MQSAVVTFASGIDAGAQTIAGGFTSSGLTTVTGGFQTTGVSTFSNVDTATLGVTGVSTFGGNIDAAGLTLTMTGGTIEGAITIADGSTHAGVSTFTAGLDLGAQVVAGGFTSSGLSTHTGGAHFKVCQLSFHNLPSHHLLTLLCSLRL